MLLKDILSHTLNFRIIIIPIAILNLISAKGQNALCPKTDTEGQIS